MPEHWHHEALPVPREVLELPLHSFAPSDVVLLLEQCIAAKAEMDSAEEDYKSIREQLAEIQQAEQLDGLRHNRLVYRCRKVAGKTTLVKDLLIHAMLMRGLAHETVDEILAYATKTGDEYYVKEIGIID